MNALFPAASAAEARRLSGAFEVPMYRASRDDIPRYSPAGGRRPCDECAARQHETRGRLTEGGGIRALARTRRHFPGDGPETALELCREHEQLWRERDVADGVPVGRLR
jgi:hypothetical protein